MSYSTLCSFVVVEIAGANGTDETQLFVEPMQWMDEVVDGQVQGKLYCPGWVQIRCPFTRGHPT